MPIFSLRHCAAATLSPQNLGAAEATTETFD
jgi:hypothetical protein